MEDEEIISLFFSRAETAISQAEDKYGKLCMSVARRILPDERDAEECVNDACMRAWNAIPPEHPRSLRSYLVKITRNLALDKYAYNNAEKRGTALTSAFEELEPCLQAKTGDAESEVEAHELSRVLNKFLRDQSKESRVFFVRRYWYGESIREIADACRVSEEKVKTSLFRTRNRLKNALAKEGITV